MEYYDSIAQGYNELYEEEQLKKLYIVKNHVKINKSSKLLDVGCGTGISSDFDCIAVGLDSSKELLRQNKNERKVLGAAEALPFKDNTFDYVISVTAIHNFSNPKKSVREMIRVGKDNFILTALKKSKKYKPIANIIKKEFKIIEFIDEGKDIVFVCIKP